MAMFVAEKLKIDPEKIANWHHSKLLTVFGYYANQQSVENYKYWLELSPEGKKGKKPPKKYIVRFLNEAQMGEIDRLKKANTIPDSNRIMDFLNGTK